MKCVIISEKQLFDLGKRCLSNMINYVNDEFYLSFNQVKRLRVLFFLACQKVFNEQIQQKLKEENDFIKSLNKFINEESVKVWNEKLLNKFINEESDEESDELWNEKLDEKFREVSMIVEKSTKGDDLSKIEEIFNSPVFEKYSRKEFSLEKIYRIFYLIKEGNYKCNELDEDLYYQIKGFRYLYYVYNNAYNELDFNFKFK